MRDFEEMTQNELLSIWDSTNSYEWNALIGPKPEDFDDLPKYKLWWQFWIKKTKSNYTKPIFYIIDSLLPREVIDEYQHRKFLEEYGIDPKLDRLEALMLRSPYPIDAKSKKTIFEYYSKYQDSQPEET